MRKSALRLSCVALLSAVAWFGGNAAVMAAEENQSASGERIERLERRINEMNQRQERLMDRLNGIPERPQHPGGATPGYENSRAGAPTSDMPATMPPTAKFLKDIAGVLHLCFLIGIIFNILIAVWIFSDIRKRGEGSGIFVVLALLAGVPAAVIYSLVRIGDRKI